jgi:Short C-terminal domain/Phospholipase_D-nuclease N-terminal
MVRAGGAACRVGNRTLRPRSSSEGDAQDAGLLNALLRREPLNLDEGETPMFAAEFGTGQVFWSMLWFFLFFLWIWLVITVFADIFRSPDLSGWGKALWSIFIIVLPYLGVFVYLIARGRQMGEHAVDEARRRDEMFRSYVQEAAGTGSGSADELSKLAALRADGVIDEAEFQRMKAKVVAA